YSLRSSSRFFIARLLFLIRSDVSQHLHAFPTRRSSDLSPAELPGPLTGSEASRRLLSSEDPSRPITLWGSSSMSSECGDEATPVDRKSTRLNSSHVSISYAVFCLKKKNSYSTARHRASN